jgi:hypothetical protein
MIGEHAKRRFEPASTRPKVSGDATSISQIVWYEIDMLLMKLILISLVFFGDV